MGFTDETVRFNLDDSNQKEISETLKDVTCHWMKRYNPINQIVGYVLGGDPAYVPCIIMHGTKFVNMNEMRSWKNWYVII